MLIVIAATIVACVFIGWSIGANDAANCVGANIGSGKVTLREGIIITSLFGFLGALLIGQNVIKTVGKGIVPLHAIDPKLAMLIALSACFGAGAWVILATVLRLPVSTSHSIVGAVAGAGLAVGAPVIWEKIGNIFISWVATPFGSALIAFIIYYPFRFIFYRVTPPLLRAFFQRWMLVLTSCYLAFTWGGNDVANATGVITGASLTTPLIAILIGAGAIVLGIVTMGYRVIETVGYKITRLLPLMSIAVAAASAANVHVYTHLGIPVSTSHSIVGAIVGVGLVTGKHVFNIRLARDIIFAWAITPFAAGFVALMIMTLIKSIAGL
ncbi:MAG: inorganic phosphate transporter [Candidatus Margulisiibacteriota bacterium]